MPGFRTPRTVLREAVGAYVDGTYVPGVRSVVTTEASVQPTKPGDLHPMPEGRHLSDFVKLYTDDRLQVTADGEGVQPDIIVHGGYGYELIDIDPNQNDVISHYKYLAAKVFKYTTDADWISGALERP